MAFLTFDMSQRLVQINCKSYKLEYDIGHEILHYLNSLLLEESRDLVLDEKDIFVESMEKGFGIFGPRKSLTRSPLSLF